MARQQDAEVGICTAIPRIQRDRGTVALLGFALAIARGQQYPQVGVHRGIFGIQRNRPPVAGFGFVPAAVPCQQEPKVVMCLSIARVQDNRLPVTLFGVRFPMAVRLHEAEVVVRLCFIGIARDRLTPEVLCLPGVAEAGGTNAGEVQEIDVLCVQGQCLGGKRQGLRHLSAR